VAIFAKIVNLCGKLLAYPMCLAYNTVMHDDFWRDLANCPQSPKIKISIGFLRERDRCRNRQL
jgi:hypothetical protein